MPSSMSGDCQVECYVSLTASYHLALDFTYDDFFGVPTGITSITATVGGAMTAAAGFKFNATGTVTDDIGPEQVFSDHLADITVYIGPVPLTLNFEGELSYSSHVAVQGPSVHANAEISYTKTVAEGVHYDGSQVTQINDDSPLQQTITEPTITGSDANMGAAVTLTIIPRITMTLEGILPFYAELTPHAKIEAADSSGTVSVGVSVGIGATVGVSELDLDMLKQYCGDQDECTQGLDEVATLGGLLPHSHDFTLVDDDCIEGTCSTGGSSGGGSSVPAGHPPPPPSSHNQPPSPPPHAAEPCDSTYEASYNGDDECDAACNNAACNWDYGDCCAETTCNAQEKGGDGNCDTACNNPKCNYDMGDCNDFNRAVCPPRCQEEWRGERLATWRAAGLHAATTTAIAATPQAAATQAGWVTQNATTLATTASA